MFRTKRNYPYNDLAKIPETREYKIMTNDVINIVVTPNKGALLVEMGTNNSNTLVAKNVTATVEYDGTVKLPILGRVFLKDLSMREAELFLEERFKEFYVDPYVQITIINKRVILFPGYSGAARVITLPYQNTTLTEAIAMSGGITGNGKAHRVKLIRGNPANPDIYLIDLSTIEGMKAGNIVLQGNDIIYVEPVNDYVVNFANRVSVYFVSLNFLLLLYSLLK
jgi:polysaccharide export outer membrane protein